jgi:hypothetical protein
MKSDIRGFLRTRRDPQPTHTVMPENVLSQLCPLDADAANQVYQNIGPIPYGQGRKHFYSLKQKNALEHSSSFLASLAIDDDSFVVLSWGCRGALRTTWGIFTRYWNDFCQPVDDVTIIPEDKSWLLCYTDEYFWFGKRRND